MEFRGTLFQPDLKIKKNFLLRWKNLRTNAKKLRKAITQTLTTLFLSSFYLKKARVCQLMELS